MYTTHSKKRWNRIAANGLLTLVMLASNVAPAFALHDAPRIQIENDQVIGSPFDPRTEPIQIWYHLPQRVAQVTVEILRGGNVVKTLFQGAKSSGTHYVAWEDGLYDNGNIPFWGAHTYCITAELRDDRVRECGALSVEYRGNNPFGLDAEPEEPPAQPAQPAPEPQPAQPVQPVQPAAPQQPAQPQFSGAIVAVTPANREIDFGNVRVGETKSQNVTLKNLGSAQLYFYVIDSPSNTAFQSSTFSKDTFTEAIFIAPGQSYTFSVSFTPTVTGFQEARLVLRTNDSSRRNITFDMFGWGTRVIPPTPTPPAPPAPPTPTPTPTPTPIAFDLKDFGPSKNEFNPKKGETVSFSYNVNKKAFITVAVDGKFLTFNQSGEAGNHAITWDGKNTAGAIVNKGTYNYTIVAYTLTGEVDEAKGTVRVTEEEDNQDEIIRDFRVSPITFNPFIENVRFEYFLNMDAYITLRILDADRIVRTISRDELAREGRQTLVWDGRDASGFVLPEGRYRYEFLANAVKSGIVSMKRIGNVTVDYDGRTGVDTFGACEGFIDVHATDPICPAVRFAKERGIFLGDDISNQHQTKTIRLRDPMNRAETAAVLLRTMKIPLVPYNRGFDGNLGFWDLDTAEWYMSPFKTAIKTAAYYQPEQYGYGTGYGTMTIPVMAGYPDGSMKPFRGAKRSEIYKIFIESALTSPTVRANFMLNRFITHSVFADTPATLDRQWYLPYADWVVRYFNNTEFARRYFGNYNLINDRSARFGAGETPTRGEIIELIYESQSKNLIDLN